MTEVLTHTKRRDFKTCPRYFFHRHEQHLVPRAEKRGRRRGSFFGSLVFAVQQAQEDGRLTPGHVHSWTDDSTAQALAGAIEGEALRLYSEVMPGSTEEAFEVEVEQVKLEVMALEYVLRYGVDARRELIFELPLVNPSTGRSSRAFRRGGKIDGMVVVGPQRARVIEDKFVGQIQKAMIDRLPLDDQVSEYVDALLAKGWTAEVAYRHTLFPGINPTKEKIPPALAPSGKPSQAKHVPAETLEDFRVRLRADIASRPGHYFDQQVLLFPQEHLDDFRRGRWGTAKAIMASRLDARQDWQRAFPMSPSRCWEWGGCEFIPLCTKREGAEDLYTIVPDNPELITGGITSEYAQS